jgi:hypothetical protein
MAAQVSGNDGEEVLDAPDIAGSMPFLAVTAAAM